VTIAAGAAYAQCATDRLVVALPRASWAVEIRTPGFTVQKDDVAPDGTQRYVYAVGPDGAVPLSVRLQRAPEVPTPEACRVEGWDRLRTGSPFRMDDVRMSQTGQFAILEYIVKEVKGLPIEQKNLHGFLAKDDVCVEIHVSKVRFTPADRPALAAILKSARIRPRGGPVF
jgi:hypothetical protein